MVATAVNGGSWGLGAVGGEDENAGGVWVDRGCGAVLGRRGICEEKEDVEEWKWWG